MERDSVYVVTYGGTPLKVCYDVNSAVEFIQEMVDDNGSPENYFIHETLMQDPYMWIKRGVELAEKGPSFPAHDDALDWMVSEVGEAVGARVASRGAWLRNNPEKHKDDSVSWEIGQAIMMGILALGRTPVGIIRKQLEKWGYKQIGFTDDSQAFYEMLFKFPRSE